MKKLYTKPSVEIVSFKTENIMTVSAGSTQAQTSFGTLDIDLGTVEY